MHEEDIVEHTNDKLQAFRFQYTKKKLLLSVQIPCANCVHFSQLVHHWATKATPRNTIEHAHAKILVNTVEYQVSWSDTYNELFDH